MNKINNWGYIIAIILSLTLTIPPHLFAKDKKDPVEIYSDRMRSEDGGLKIIFSGNVVGYWGDLKITCDILEVYNTRDKKETEESLKSKILKQEHKLYPQSIISVFR